MDNYLSIADLCLSTTNVEDDEDSFVNRTYQIASALLRGYLASCGATITPTSSIRQLYVAVRRRHIVLPDSTSKLSVMLDKAVRDNSANKLRLTAKQRVFILAACKQLREGYYIRTTRQFVIFDLKDTPTK